jgi:hypothetical protein
MCTEPKLTSNWHSRADTLSLRVRNPRHRSSSETFLFGKFVREQGRSWTGAFVNRGSTVLVFDRINILLIWFHQTHNRTDRLNFSLRNQRLLATVYTMFRPPCRLGGRDGGKPRDNQNKINIQLHSSLQTSRLPNHTTRRTNTLETKRNYELHLQASIAGQSKYLRCKQKVT